MLVGKMGQFLYFRPTDVFLTFCDFFDFVHQGLFGSMMQILKLSCSLNRGIRRKKLYRGGGDPKEDWGKVALGTFQRNNPNYVLILSTPSTKL